ncbi:HAMP domain-containing histidine kinase [Acetobacterium wieringae]|uniref:histidine kinase n=1 Tax=Acetobacterium wieringae TaxID=52694 RepID=A0A5D0WTE6_9FIRM|nr:HAMP domain-containing sensor histidine kinase [Acetobacterium wieringae]TYC87417.1 HAMP domain-containing histidine kinase [Acetobacterium wieringae]
MATKLKTIWTDQKFKITCSFLTVVLVTISFGALFEAYWFNWDYLANTNNYLESAELQNKVLTAYDHIDQVYNFYQSEENIRAGNAIDPAAMEAYKWDILAELDLNDPDEMGVSTESEMLTDPDFWEPYADELEAPKKQLINEGLFQYERLKKELEQTQGLSYVINSKGVTNSQPKDANPDDLLKRRVNFTYNKGAISSTLPKMDQFEPLDYAVEPDFQVIIGFDDAYIAEREVLYQAERQEFLWLMSIFVVSLILAAIGMLLSCISAGRKKDNEGVQLLPIDAFWIDAHFLLLLVVETLVVAAIVFFYDQNFPRVVMLMLFAVGAALGLNFLLSLVRILKDRRFGERLLFLKLIKKGWGFIKNQFKKLAGYYNDVMKGSPTVKRLMFWAILLVILALSVQVPILGVCSFICIIYLLYLGGIKAKKYDGILEGLERIKNGEVDYKLIGYDGALGELADGINAIGDGISLAVSEEVKSQRLKTELLTNVSHDIRTPLTSIITSIDLLKNGNLDPEAKQKYLEILENKAHRLKVLTDDLFEAAKASSGNIEVEFQAVDLEMLMTQGLGEMEEELGNSQLEFITQYPKDLFVVTADGRLLWRVIENLLFNILKYAQKESRVYIEFSKCAADKTGIVVFKNVSAQPLNISPEELMERFKRGDETRNSEGSGLGLAIAKDLMTIQQGELRLEIDGDLFKAVIILPMAE